jgi:hypothetical protein
VWVAAVVLVVVVAAVVGVKVLADRNATRESDARVAEVEQMLSGSTPEDFLAFNSGRQVEGTVAREVADQGDFVSVDARAGRSVIRFQPEGWWQGFTERCVVAVVRAGGVEVTAPKTACVRVDPASY